jgi:hypothetical protein
MHGMETILFMVETALFMIVSILSLGTLCAGRMPKVRLKPNSAFNKNNRFEFLSKAWCQNVCFWPASMMEANPTEFLAIYRHSKNRILDK